MNHSELDNTKSSLLPTSFQSPLYVSSHSVTRLSPCLQSPSSTSPTCLSPGHQNLSSSPSSRSPTRLSPNLVSMNSSSPSRLSPTPQPVSSSDSLAFASPCPSSQSSSPAIQLSPCLHPHYSSPTRLSPCPQLLPSHSSPSLSPCSTLLSSPVILKRPLHISTFSDSGRPLDPSAHISPCSSKSASGIDSLESSRKSLPSNQPSDHTTVQSDNKQTKLTTTSCSERRAKSIPISKTIIQQKQRHEQIARYQYQGKLSRDVSLEETSIKDIMTKKENMSRQNLKHIGRGTQSLAFSKKKHITKDPVLIQARLGLNKTGKSKNVDSRLLFDKARSKLNQALLKMQKDKDMSVAVISKTKPEAGTQTSGLTNRLQIKPKSDNQLKPSNEIIKDNEELVSTKKQSNKLASSSSSKALNCDPDIQAIVVSKKIKHEGPAEVHENSNSSVIDLNTTVTENHESAHLSKLRFTASETNTCIHTPGQTKQKDCFRIPLKIDRSAAESSHLARICRPESETTTSNYIYTPSQVNQNDQFHLKSRTCRRVIKGAGSLSDRKSTCLISTQARKKDSSQETGRRGSQKKDISKPSQKSSDTDSTKSNSSRASSLEEGTLLRKHKRLEIHLKSGRSCSTQSTSTHMSREKKDEAVIHMASHDLSHTRSPLEPYIQPDQRTHTAIPKLSMCDSMPQSGTDEVCEQLLTEEESLTDKQVNFAQLHQQDISLLSKPSVSEARKCDQEIIPLPSIFTCEYKPNDL